MNLCALIYERSMNLNKNYFVIAIIILSVAIVISSFEISDALRDLGESIGVGLQKIQYK